MPVYSLCCPKCKYEYEKYFSSFQEADKFMVEGTCVACGHKSPYRIPSTLGYRRDHTVNP